MPVADPSDASLARRFFDLRYPDGFCCRRCGHRRGSQLRSRPRVWVCHDCRSHHSVTAGTPLHGSKLDLATIVRAAELLARTESISARRLRKELRIGLEAAWALAHRLRAGLVTRPTRLQSEVAITGVSLMLRGVAPLLPKRELEYHSVVLVATDEQDHATCDVTTDRWFAPTDLVNPDGDQREVRRWQSENPIAAWISSVIHDVHCLVSVRWLARYVGALAAVQSAAADGEDPPVAALRTTLRTRGRGFLALRPPKNTWHPSFRPDTTPQGTVELAHVELPIRRQSEIERRYAALGASPAATGT